MSATESSAAMTAHSIDFIDEDDAGSILLALLEKVAHAARADAHKHLHEIRTGDREKWNVGFAGDRAGQQSLARARRSHEQHALRNSSAELLEFLGIFQEFDDFLQLFLGFVGSGDVLESGFLLLRGEQPRAGLAKTQGFVSTSLHLPQEEQTKADEENERSSVQQNQNPVAAADFLNLDLDGLVPKSLCDLGRIFLGDDRAELLVWGFGVFALQLVAVRREVHGDFLDLIRVDLGHQQAVTWLFLSRLRTVGGNQFPEHDAQKHNGKPEENCF